MLPEFSSTGIDCPKDIVAGLRRPLHSSQRGALSPPAIAALNCIPVVPFVTVQAGHVHGGAVKFQYFVRRITGLKVKAVDVLCDQAVELSKLLELCNGKMCPVGFGIFHRFVHLRCHLPVFLPGSFTFQKPLKIKVLRIVLLPNASGTSEIGNSGFRAETCANEHHDSA